MNFRQILLLLFLSLPFALFQSTQTFSQSKVLVKGKLVDSATGKPVSFASVRLKLNGRGVISNAGGDFLLQTDEMKDAETLLISCIGYSTKQIPLNQLYTDKLNTIILSPADAQLGEVVVQAEKEKELSSFKIIREAITRIPQNYPTIPFSYVAYYRDYQYKDSTYQNLNEAIVEVFDKGFETVHEFESTIKLYRYQQNMAFARDTATDVAYDNRKKNKFVPSAIMPVFGGNELSILFAHDAIRNNRVRTYSFLYIFSKDFLLNHLLDKPEIVYLDGSPLYSISFTAKPQVTGKSYKARGKIYIDPVSFAMHKITYETYADDLPKDKALYAIQVEYKKLDGFMHLNYISFNNYFTMRATPAFQVEQVTAEQEGQSLIVRFNNNTDLATVLITNNYTVWYKRKKINVNKVKPVGKSAVRLYLEKNNGFDLTKLDQQSASELKIEYGQIYDVEGHELNKVSAPLIHQYRELFVQETFANKTITDNKYRIRKNSPLKRNIQQPLSAALEAYWMNTPLQK